MEGGGGSGGVTVAKINASVQCVSEQWSGALKSDGMCRRWIKFRRCLGVSVSQSV